MNYGSGTTRWWENYLVRYLMPSIAGVAIILWLCAIGGDDIRDLLLVPTTVEDVSGPTLILLFLYGNLFCYIASYPILGFHVTRVLDFENNKWPKHKLIDGYISTIVLAVLVFLVSICAGNNNSYIAAFVLATIFSGLQIYRIYIGMKVNITVDGLSGDVSPVYGFAYAMARRRGIPIETKRTTERREVDNEESSSQESGDGNETETIKHINWRPEFIETYRHLREHGNSAFIFVLELILAGLVYLILMHEEWSHIQQLSAIGILLVIWATPALLIHLVGQNIERRFSKFDSRT